jgi:hypothetical protein
VLVPEADTGEDSVGAAAEVVSVQTLAPSFQRMPALPQSALVSGWPEMSAASTVEDSVGAAAEVVSVHTLALSFQRMPALSQSARVRGWLEVSAASTVEATTKALAKAKIEAIAFMACLTDQLSSSAC